MGLSELTVPSLAKTDIDSETETLLHVKLSVASTPCIGSHCKSDVLLYLRLDKHLQ